MSLRYFRIPIGLARISFEGDPEDAAEAVFCDVQDPRSGEFVRRNDMLDDILNAADTVEMTEQAFQLEVTARQSAQDLAGRVKAAQAESRLQMEEIRRMMRQKLAESPRSE